ncbi:MAG: hypothetical protein BWY84_00354 [Candidatus Aerophobetes bacterium ADurb.Bin490]|nr:MAG: hypothetical protein BWY84_00354 [Candidatus Aerophobetes bacterium ADurb.Bin490]
MNILSCPFTIISLISSSLRSSCIAPNPVTSSNISPAILSLSFKMCIIPVSSMTDFIFCLISVLNFSLAAGSIIIWLSIFLISNASYNFLLISFFSSALPFLKLSGVSFFVSILSSAQVIKDFFSLFDAVFLTISPIMLLNS